MNEYDHFTTDLLHAWERWDTHCTRVHADHNNHNKEPLGCPTTVAMETACQAYAANIGMGCGPMRAQMATERRAGLSREEILSTGIRTNITTLNAVNDGHIRPKP